MLRTNDTLLTESCEREAAVNQLRRSEAYLAEAQRLTKTGSWAWTPGAEENWSVGIIGRMRCSEFLNLTRGEVRPHARCGGSESTRRIASR